MERRKFIRNISLGTAATIGVPYLLPTGRLFAATGSRVANHVVFCLFAGGIRNLESVHKLHGNLMPYTLKGSESINSAFSDGVPPITPTAPSFGQTLQEQGVLYKEFRFAEGSTGHYGAHATAMTGVYTGDLTLNTSPSYPTIFELYRKHNTPSMPAKNAWWVSDSEGLYAHLNYSTHADYGARYGANYIQPSSFTGSAGVDSLGNPKEYDDEDVEKIKSIRRFCDNHFSTQYSGMPNSIVHNEAEKKEIEEFLTQWVTNSGDHKDPWGVGKTVFNSDMKAVHCAEMIIEKFQPELLVVNMHEADIAHEKFTKYANNLHKMDYALAHLWNTIQSTKGMANDTILIAMPEHGRNEDGNGDLDQYGLEGLDHNHGKMSREIFALILGPTGVVVQDKVLDYGPSTPEYPNGEPLGESIDIVPTIAHILGFDNDIPGGLLNGNVLTESFY